MTADPHSVGDILDRLDALAAASERIRVEDVLHAFGNRTFGPAIMIPALLEITPVGAVPGVPSLLAAIIAVVALQKLVGRAHVWIPRVLAARSVSGARLAAGAAWLRPMARFMDRYFHGRLRWLTRRPFSQLAAGVVLLLCACVPFLEVLPFASSAPMLVIAFFGVAMLVRDGALMSVALAASLGALGLAAHDWWDAGFSDTEAADGIVEDEHIAAVEETAEEAGERVKALGEEAVREVGENAADGVGAD